MARAQKHEKLPAKTVHWRHVIFAAAILAAIGACIQFVYHPPVAHTANDDATVQHALPYCNSKDPAQTLNFYRPKGSEGKVLPLVVYIHGGGWRSGSKNNKLITATYGPFFLQRGIAVASIDYRLHPKNPYPDQNNDVSCALQYVNTQAKELGVDPQKIVLFGDSAGGQLAALAAFHRDDNDYRYQAPRGVIDFYGVSDFSELINDQHSDMNARRYLGQNYRSAIVSASPVTHVVAHAPRFLIIHGTKDKIVPIGQSQELYHQLTAAGNTAVYVAIPDAKHGFIGPELPAAQYQTIKNSLATFLRDTGMIDAE